MQTGAFGRGMGQHVRGLLKSALKSAPKSIEAICFVYSSSLDTTNIETVKKELAVAAPNAPVEFYGIATIAHNLDQPGSYDAAYAHNGHVYKEFYEQHATGNDVWFNPCPMQEPVVPVVLEAKGLKMMVMWYDLMPYLMHDHYFPDPTTPFAHSYLSRMNLLLHYDHILAISNTSKNDLVRYLALDPGTITNVRGWVNTEMVSGGKLPKTVKKPYILLNASPEPNKNAARAIEAFHAFNKAHGSAYQLVVTSDYNPKMDELVTQLGANVVFIGHVSAPDLKEVFLGCEVLLFPSLYEGLGMPPLEAVNLGKKVIISDIPVHREFGADTAFYWCGPYDVSSISAAIGRSIEGGSALTDLQKKVYAKIRKNFSWDISAGITWDVIGSVKHRTPVNRRIAVVGPHPSSFSSIGKFVAETYPAMTKCGQVDYYYERGPSDRRHGKVRFNYLEANTSLKPVSVLVNSRVEYDTIVYHLGNSDHHMLTYLLSHAKPGTLVLHDTDLGGNGLSGQMLSHGYISRERLAIERQLETEYLQQPERFITSVVSAQQKVVVHSDYALEVGNSYRIGKTPISRLEHPLRAVEHVGQKQFSNRPLRLGIAGIMTEVKGVNTIDWLMDKTNKLQGAELYVFGFGFFADKATLRELEAKYDNLHVSFDLTDMEFNNAMEKLDVLINFREVYKGEASRATLEAIRERVVPIVRNVGWFGELPDDVAYKLDVIDEMPLLVRQLIANPNQLETMVDAGQRLLVQKFTPEAYVTELLK